MTMGISCTNYQARFGFEEVLGGAEGENTAAVRKAIQEEILPRHLGFFDKVIADGGTGWVAGTDGPTIADFVLVPRLQWIKASGIPGGIIGGEELFKPFPNVNALISKLMTLPSVMAYYSGLKATCTVGPAGKPCSGAPEQGSCTGEITLEQLDASTCKIRYTLACMDSTFTRRPISARAARVRALITTRAQPMFTKNVAAGSHRSLIRCLD